MQLPTSLSNLRDTCHLNRAPTRNQKGCPPHFTKALHLSPPLPPPPSAAEKSLFFLAALEEGEGAERDPPRYWNSNTQRRLTP